MLVKLPETDLKSAQSMESLELKSQDGELSGSTFGGRATAGRCSYSADTRAHSKPYAECQAFVDGVLADRQRTPEPFKASGW